MKREITIEQIKWLKESYEDNKVSLAELENHIEEYGVTDYGLDDVGESFEQGYNNAMEYVFRTLGIEY